MRRTHTGLAGLVSLLAVIAAMPSGVAAAESMIGTVTPVLETGNFPDNDHDADADDPAFWIDPADPAKSLVLAAVKNGGIRVFDLAGKTIQAIDPLETEAGKGRINNIDVAYGFKLADGTAIDIAVASDRGLDVIRVFRIDPAAAHPLTEITDLTGPRPFPTRAKADGSGEEDNPVDDQNTVYGIALWNDRANDAVTVVGTQRHQPRVGVFKLVPTAEGKVRAELARNYDFPATYQGQDLFAEVDDEPLKSFSPQFEGSVVDQETGIAYLGQEDVGIWRIDLAKGVADAAPAYATRGSTASSFNNPSSVISRDVEGLTIYYGKPGEKYLIASSQGGAHGDEPAPDAPYDDTFAVFDITADAPASSAPSRWAAIPARGSMRFRKATAPT